MSKSVKRMKIEACRSVYNHATGQIAAFADMAQAACDEARKLGVVSLAAECNKPKCSPEKTAKRTVAKKATVAGAVLKATKTIYGCFDTISIMAVLKSKRITPLATKAQVGRALCKLASQQKIRRIDVGLYEVVR